MKKWVLSSIIIGIVIIGALLLFYKTAAKMPTPMPPVVRSVPTAPENPDAPLAPLAWPLDGGEDRDRKLTFGLFVTPDPQENPIDPPERFSGYHTALDLEIFEEEEGADVSVWAACDGSIIQIGEVPGYGGVIIQSCVIQGESVTVLYGHLDFRRFQHERGDKVKRDDSLGFLGEHKSDESGGTRKHLHFAVHKGPKPEVRGYVETPEDLAGYLDPLPLLTQ